MFVKASSSTATTVKRISTYESRCNRLLSEECT